MTSRHLKPILLTLPTSVSSEERSWYLGCIDPNRLGTLNNDLHQVSQISGPKVDSFTGSVVFNLQCLTKMNLNKCL